MSVGVFKLLRSFGVVFFGCLLLVVFAICGAMVQYPVRAVFWHCTHGKYVNVGNATLALPLLWWPQNEKEGGTIALRRAAIDYRFAFMPSEIRLIPLKPGSTISDDEDAERIQSAFMKELSGNTRQPFVPIVIAAPAGKLFCGIDRAVPEALSLFCLSSRFRWRVWFGPGSIQEEAETESILSTLK